MVTTAGVRASAQTRLRWELLTGLVRKDLKVKYKDSVLGFAWSMANPLLLLAVYGFVFSIVLRNNIPNFTVYLLAGLLVWNFFASSVLTAVGSVVGNANLVKKVRFPLAVLPLSSVGFAAVHFLLQMAVFAAILLVTGYDFIGPELLLLVPAALTALVFTVALSVLVAALNVRYRDVQHILEVAVLAWFWLNPVVYAAGLVHDRLAPHGEWLYRLYFANPPGIVSATFQRAIYQQVHVPGTDDLILAAPGYGFYLQQLGLVLAGSLLLLWLAARVFRRLSGDFAEEL